MKRQFAFSFLIIILFSSGILFAHSIPYNIRTSFKGDYDTAYTREFGFNATALLKNITPFNKLELVSFFPYDFNYKQLKKNKRKFYRFGFTFRSEFIRNKFDIASPEKKHFIFAFRSGSEKHRKINDHWYFITGNDFRGGFDQNPDASVFSPGFQLFIGYAYSTGLEYRFQNRFRLYTEAALLLSAHTSADDNSVPAFGNSVDTGISLEINMPAFIMFSYAF
jgi:hypothetical protein